MKNLKALYSLVLITFFCQTLTAQMKVGTNPTNINPQSNLEVEAPSGRKLFITKDSSWLGIGTLPYTSLHIAGSSNSWRHGLMLEENGANFPHRWALNSRSDFPGFAISDETRSYIAMTINNNTGNMGLGTSSPASRIEAVGNDGITVSIQDTGLKTLLYFRSYIATDSISDWKLYKADGKTLYKSGLHLYSYPKNGTYLGNCCHSRMTWLDNGNVGIGTSSPEWELDVRKNSAYSEKIAHFVNTSISPTAESQVCIGGGPGTWTKIVGYNGALGFRNYDLNSEFMTMRPFEGFVGIGNANPTNKLHISATINPVRIEGMETTSNKSFNLVVTDAYGVLKQTTRDSLVSSLGVSQIRCIIQKTNSQSFSDGATGIVDFNTVNFNPNNSFDLSNDVYNIPVNGVYELKLNGKVSISGGTGNGHMAFQFEIKNMGSNIWIPIYSLWSRPVPQPYFDLPSGSVMYSFSAGDQVRLNVQNCNGCGTTATISNLYFSTLLVLKQ